LELSFPFSLLERVDLSKNTKASGLLEGTGDHQSSKIVSVKLKTLGSKTPRNIILLAVTLSLRSCLLRSSTRTVDIRIREQQQQAASSKQTSDNNRCWSREERRKRRMTNLAGKVVLITGASSGIGTACARLFAKEGSKLILTARRADRLAQLKEELLSGSPAAAAVHIASLDVRDFKQVQDVVRGLPEEFKNIDVLVNNAGLAVGVNLVHDTPMEDYERMMDTNVKVTLNTTNLMLLYTLLCFYSTLLISSIFSLLYALYS